MGIFDGGTDWGVNASEVWSTTLLIVGSLAGFLVLAIAVYTAPSIMYLIRQAAVYKANDYKREGNWKWGEFSSRVRRGTDWRGRRTF